jgi:N-glycosylase/DNA lyase
VHMYAQRLVEHLSWLRKSEVAEAVRRRMDDFRNLGAKGNEDWFSEMCFCILTADSRAKMGMRIQEELGPRGFLSMPVSELRRRLKEAGHRFPNARSQFIVEARKFRGVKDIISNLGDARLSREWLVENVRGLGYKEASHFLRNVGFDCLAILDRHVLTVACEYGMIKSAPPTLTRKRYLETEGVLLNLAERLKLSAGELDLYLWYMKTGEVLK